MNYELEFTYRGLVNNSFVALREENLIFVDKRKTFKKLTNLVTFTTIIQ